MNRYRLKKIDKNEASVVDTRTDLLIARFYDTKKAMEYVEILNCKENNIATILRQISEEVDEAFK